MKIKRKSRPERYNQDVSIRRWCFLVLTLSLVLGVVTGAFGQLSRNANQQVPSSDGNPVVGSSIIVPGDVLGVQVAGFESLSGPVLVLGDGTVTGTGFEHVMVEGMTLEQAKVAITKALAKTVKAPYVSVVMVRPIAQFVYVVGSTAVPGPHPYVPGLTIRQLIGEVSLPDIPTRLDAVLNRADGSSLNLNLEKILHDNDPVGLTKIKPNDVLVILPKARVRIWVDGLVERPGEIRVDEGVDVYQAIDAAGGINAASFAPTTSNFTLGEAKIVVQRGKQQFDFPIRQSLKGPSFKIEANDVVSVVTPKLIRVVISGQVNSAGEHLVPSGSTVFQAIQDSSGTWPSATLTDVTVFRGEDAFQVNADYHKNHLPEPFKVKDGDIIYVHHNERRIYVLGLVNSPGRFIIRDGQTMTAVKALALAKGLAPTGSFRRVYLIHPDGNGKFTKFKFNLDDFLKDGKASANPVMHSGDVLLFGGPKGITFGDIAQIISTAYLLRYLL